MPPAGSMQMLRVFDRYLLDGTPTDRAAESAGTQAVVTGPTRR